MSAVTPEQKAYQQALLQWLSIMEDALVKIREGIISKPDTEEPPIKPTEGTVKEGGWGANTDVSTWKIVNMRDFPELFKIVDSAGKNVATHFSTEANAQIFIDYMKTQPVPTDPVDPKPEPTEPDNPTEGAFGVKSIFGNGAVITSYNENFRDDGKRFDFTKLKTKGQELTGFFRLTAPLPKDEVSGKWSTISHSGSNRTDCYDLGVSTEGGRSRFRFEQIHPNYTGDLATGDVPAPKLGNKFIGYKFIKRVNPDNSVNLQIYVDASGENENDKPANKWSKIFDHTDTKYKIGVVQPFATLRIDDQEKKGLKQVEEKWIQLVEIK